MPFIGYAQVGELVGKSEDEVREDRKNRLFDLDNPESLVKYVARSWGWTPPNETPAKPAAPPARRAPSKVTDNVEPTVDPYLDRMRARR